MLSAVTALVIAFVVATVATPLVRARALRYGVVDVPGGRRVHLETTPRLGGVAVYVAFLAPLTLFLLYETETMRRFLERPSHVVGLLLGGTIVATVGAVDDVRGLGAWRKLLAQTVAAGVAYAFEYRIDAVNIPGLGSLEMGWLSFPVTLLWFLGIINALNLIDGLDGLAAGIAFFASVTNFVISYCNGAFVGAMLSASLAGALLGFLRYNFNPAQIFMGDSGSMFLGFVLAATSIAGATTKSSTAVAIIAPMVALGVPIFDTMLAMIRRTLARQPIFSADRGHIHHRLLDLGLTHRRVVLILYASSVFLALAAVGIAFGRSWQLGGALILAGGVLFALVRFAGAAQRPRRPLNDESDRASVLRSLQKRIDVAIRKLGACADYVDVERVLTELGGDRRLLSQVMLEPQTSTDALNHLAGRPTALVFHFGVPLDGKYRLHVELNPHLLPVADEARYRLAPVALACEEALANVASRASRPQLMVAQ